MKKLRFDSIDDLPIQRVSHEDPNYHKYKCRTNWFQGLISNLKFLFHSITDETIKQEVQDYLDWKNTVDWQKFRTKEEIDRSNIILDKLINHFESE